MMSTWRRRRAQKRIEPGDGRRLARFRWWQLPGRALFHLEPGPEGTLEPGPSDTFAPGPAAYTVDVRHWQNQSSGEVKARLYRDGRQTAVSRLPAAFPVEGGTIEVAMSSFGMKRCHFVADDSTERRLTPDPRSAEGRRARFEHDHPTSSRAIGIASILVLLVGVALLLQQIIVPLGQIPPVVERFGRIEPLIVLPLWLTITVGVITALASAERGLRMRYSVLLDAAGN